MKWSIPKHLRPTPWDGLIVLLVVGAAIALSLSVYTAQSDQRTAQITLDGVLIGEYELWDGMEPILLPIDSPYPLTIEVAQGEIRIAESACPGGDCLHSGWVSGAGEQIICLPNRLVISVVGDTTPEFDAIVG